MTRLESRFPGAVACAVVVSPLPAASEEAVIGHVVTREYKVTILSTVAGIRYSVRDATGRALAEQIAPEQLLASYPEAYRTIASGVADDSRVPSAIIWAGK